MQHSQHCCCTPCNFTAPSNLSPLIKVMLSQTCHAVALSILKSVDGSVLEKAVIAVLEDDDKYVHEYRKLAWVDKAIRDRGSCTRALAAHVLLLQPEGGKKGGGVDADAVAKER